jgi:peptidase E
MSEAPSKEVPALLFAGGQSMNAEIVARLIAPVIARNPHPAAAYIGAANGDRQGHYDGIAALMLEAGAAKVDFVRLARESVDAAAVRKILGEADIIFISGGEVEHGMNWLKKHGLIGFLRELHANGTQFMGVSAGTIMMGKHWVRWDDPADADAANPDTAELFDCLGLVPATFDTHAEYEDWVELKAALRLMGEGARGYGLPSGGLISADSAGRLVNIEKELLVYVNHNGSITLDKRK